MAKETKFIYDPSSGNITRDGQSVVIRNINGTWNEVLSNDTTNIRGIIPAGSTINGIPLYNGTTAISEGDLIKRLQNPTPSNSNRKVSQKKANSNSIKVTSSVQKEKPKLQKKTQKSSISYFNDVGIQKNWKGKEGEIDQKSLDMLRQLGINTTNAREAQKALNKFIKNSKQKGRIAVDNKWGTQSRTALEDLWKEYVFGYKVFNTPVTVQSNQPVQLINPGQERMERMTPQTQQTWGLSNVPNEQTVVVQPAIDAVGQERMSRMSPEAQQAWGYYKKGGRVRFMKEGDPAPDKKVKVEFTTINPLRNQSKNQSKKQSNSDRFINVGKNNWMSDLYLDLATGNIIDAESSDLDRISVDKNGNYYDIDTGEEKTNYGKRYEGFNLIKFFTPNTNSSFSIDSERDYGKQMKAYAASHKLIKPGASSEKPKKVEPVKEKPTDTATKSNDKKTTTKVNTISPSKWFNNYGLTRTNNRNISEQELAQLKEMGFTGSSTDDAQQFLNDWIKAKKYSEAGEAAGLIKKDGYWGGQSQKSLAELYNKFNSNKPKPEAVVEVKTEQPTKPVLKPIQQSAVINPGTYNTSTVYDDNYIRGFRNNRFNNVTDYWNYIQGDNEHSKLWNNIFNGLSPYQKRQAYDQIMKQYGINGNLGWRDSRRLADLLNDLNLIGMNGSPTRNSYLSAVRSRYVPSSPYRESFTNYRPTAVSVSSGLDTQLVPRTVQPNLVVEVPTQEELYNKAIGQERVSRLSPETRLQQGYYRKGGQLNFIRVVQ